MERKLIICGDLHGELPTLVYKAPENSDILVVGDIGVGFGGPNSFKVQVESVKKSMDRKNLMIYCIRGNHDDPDFFDGTIYSDRLTLLEDHKPFIVGKKLIYPIGGAPSHDKKDRLAKNEKLKSYGSNKRIWWDGECIVKNIEKLPTHIDIMLSHDSPTFFEPPLIRNDEIDYDTYEQMKEGRRYLSSLLEESTISFWFFGHYHESMSGVYGECMWRCLKPLELFNVY